MCAVNSGKHWFVWQSMAYFGRKSMLVASYMVLLALPAAVAAEEPNNNGAIKAAIVDKMITAYGGAALLQANSIKVVDYNKGPWPGEGESPDVPELWRINEELTIDYKNRRKSLLSYRVPRSTLDLEKWVQQGDSTIMYDILHEKYSEESWANFDRLGASLERSSDTLQAKRLAGLSAEMEYSGEEYYRGREEPKPNTEEHLQWQERMDQVVGISDVIIGKQRHGPTGTVSLHFDANLTKFTNLVRPGYVPDFRD